VSSDGAEKATDKPWASPSTPTATIAKLSVFPDSDFLGLPEDALQASAAAYLT
jgi:hypothetical protein